LGYYYDPLDYTVAAIFVTNQMKVLPGTAIGFRNDFLGGLFLQDGSSLVAQGMPTNPIVLSDIEFVQEGPLRPGFVFQFASLPLGNPGFYSYGGIDFICPQAGTNADSSAPIVNMRFCNVYATADDFLLWAGDFGEGLGIAYSLASSVEWTMQDCTLQGGGMGGIVLGTPYDFSSTNATDYVYPPGSITWKNNLFNSVIICLDPSFRTNDAYSGNDGITNLNLPFYAYNNLFRGGGLMMFPMPTSASNWIFNDNLFDQAECIQPQQNLPLDAGYNGYWLTRDGSLLMNNEGNTVTNDQFFSSPPPYEVGPFGNYYMAPGTVLAGTGSTRATNLGLYYYTTATNQSLQGAATVDIGLHYVAASYGSNGWVPLETNGVPVYIADVEGNGQIPPTATNPNNAIYGNIDLDGDGMVGVVETTLGMNPLVFENPLTLTPTRYGTTTAIFEVGVSYSLLVQSNCQLVLMVDGLPATTNAPSQVAPNGNCLLILNTTTFPPGQTYFLQAHLILNQSGVSADGPLVAFNQPIVTIQPSEQTNGVGGTVTFTASGTSRGTYACTYQWFDGTNLIAGATNNTYTITNLALTDGGSYTVVVENVDGDPVTSSNAVLTVEDAVDNTQLSITLQPLSQQVVEGDAVTLAVSASGTPPFIYQWQMCPAGSQIWATLQGETNSTIAMLNFESGNAGTYCVIVSNATTNLASVPATLTDLGQGGIGNTIALVGPRQNYTFRGDTTYFIGAPYSCFADFCWDPQDFPVTSAVDLYGDTTIEGRTVIAFDNDSISASLIVHGSLICKTGPYQPAIFTSVDDFSQGQQQYEYIWDNANQDWFVGFLGTGFPQMAQNGLAYLNLDDAAGTNANYIHDIRFCYADQAVTTPTNAAILQVWNCQFYGCNSGVNSRQSGGCSTNQLHNVLFSGCNFAVAAENTCAEVDAEQVTADVFSLWDTEFPPSKVCLTNSIVLGNLGSGPVISTQNVAINPPNVSFDPVDDGNYYLADGSSCRNAGTANISTALLQQLRNKTTWAPVSIAVDAVASSPWIFSPTAPRYEGGPPDLGYYYDALDYTVAAVFVSSQVTVVPGTAIGVRNDNAAGFFLADGSSFISEGNPTNLITYADLEQVQEGPFNPGYTHDWLLMEAGVPYGGIVFFTLANVTSLTPTLTLDFSQMYLAADDSLVQAGTLPNGDGGDALCGSSSINWSMKDCSVQGGYITLGPPTNNFALSQPYPPGSISWTNDLFHMYRSN